MPFVKIFKRGEQDQEITSIIRSNCRLPEFAMGDFRAQIASIRTGERRLTNLLKRYGVRDVQGKRQADLRSERAPRSRGGAPDSGRHL